MRNLIKVCVMAMALGAGLSPAHVQARDAVWVHAYIYYADPSYSEVVAYLEGRCSYKHNAWVEIPPFYPSPFVEIVPLYQCGVS